MKLKVVATWSPLGRPSELPCISAAWKCAPRWPRAVRWVRDRGAVTRNPQRAPHLMRKRTPRPAFARTLTPTWRNRHAQEARSSHFRHGRSGGCRSQPTGRGTGHLPGRQLSAQDASVLLPDLQLLLPGQRLLRLPAVGAGNRRAAHHHDRNPGAARLSAGAARPARPLVA